MVNTWLIFIWLALAVLEDITDGSEAMVCVIMAHLYLILKRLDDIQQGGK